MSGEASATHPVRSVVRGATAFREATTWIVGALVVLPLLACNVTDTTIGDDYYGGLSVSTENSLVSVSSSTVILGSSVTLTLSLKDQNFNPFVGDLPVISFYSAGGTSAGTIGAVTNRHDGTYTAVFLASSSGTATTIHATVDGDEIRSSLPTITVSSGVSPFTQSWPFDFGTSGDYAFDSSRIDLTGGVVRLTGTDQADDDDSASGFGGKTSSEGVQWDGGRSSLRLDGTTTNRGLDSDWTPAYPHLVDYWKFDGTVGSIASGDPIPATVGNSGTAANVTTLSYASGFLDQSLSFSTGHDDVKIPVSAPATGTYSFSFWIKLNSFPATISAPISATSGGVMKWELFFTNTYTTGGESGHYEIALVNGGTSSSSPEVFGPSNLGTWHHVAVTYDSSASPTTRFYLDGSRLSNDLNGATGNFPAIDTLWIGGIRGDGNTCCSSSGQIDEVGIWNAALSPSAVQAIYQHQSASHSGTLVSRVMDALSAGASWTKLSWIPTLPFSKELPTTSEAQTAYSDLVNSSGTSGDSALATDLEGIWHLDEPSGTSGTASVKDSTGKNPGTPTNVIFGNAGKLMTAAEFDGTSGVVTVPDSASLRTGAAMTVSLWFNPSKSPTGLDLGLVSKWTSGGSTGWFMELGKTGNQARIYMLGLSTVDWGPTLPAFVGGTWYHFAYTYDGSEQKIYINAGTPIVQSATGSVTLGADPFRIGLSQGSAGQDHYFPGRIDEVSIWSRALAPAEVLQLYRRGANRIRYQARNCTASDCSDDATGANWKGPDGTNQTYFSELNNNTAPLDGTGTVKATAPSILFSDFTSPPGTSRYFQYRTILESDDTGTGCDYGSGSTWCSPELKSVTVDPTHYDSGSPTVIGKTGAGYDSLSTLTETLGSSCPSGIGYNLGVGSAYSSATWYWWDSTANSGSGGWVTADGTVAKSNDSSTITSHAAAFASTVGTGTVYFKAFLKSSGTTSCELDRLDLGGER